MKLQLLFYKMAVSMGLLVTQLFTQPGFAQHSISRPTRHSELVDLYDRIFFENWQVRYQDFASKFQNDEIPQWSLANYMYSLAALYEATSDTKYIAALNNFLDLLWTWRDDNAPADDSLSVGRTDDLRAGGGQVLKGWGAREAFIGYRGDASPKRYVHPVHSAVLLYPAALFVHYVEKSAQLFQQFGNLLPSYKTKIKESLSAFDSEFRFTRSGDYLTAEYIFSPEFSTLNCESIHPFNQSLYHKCSSYRDLAGSQLPYNMNLAFGRVYSLMAPALNSPSYAAIASRLGWHALLNLNTAATPGGEIYYTNWRYNLNGRLEDTAHASLVVSYFHNLLKNKNTNNDLIHQHNENHGTTNNFPRVHYLPVNSQILTRFGNVFQHLIIRNGQRDLAHNVDGWFPQDLPNPTLRFNYACNGWLLVSFFNPSIKSKCHQLIVNDGFIKDYNLADLILAEINGI